MRPERIDDLTTAIGKSLSSKNFEEGKKNEAKAMMAAHRLGAAMVENLDSQDDWPID